MSPGEYLASLSGIPADAPLSVKEPEVDVAALAAFVSVLQKRLPLRRFVWLKNLFKLSFGQRLERLRSKVC